ncbi:hypothetical protein FRC01_013017, partial [Tulasnella sp. 417]
MSAPNLTPEQQKLLSLMQLFESTGGSEGYLRHLEAIQSATENEPQIDKNKEGLIYSEVDITIVANEPMNDYYTIDVTTKPDGVGGIYYEGKGYGLAPGAIDAKFSGNLILSISWDQVIKAGPISFKAYKPDPGIPGLIDWECYIDGKAVMSFGGEAPGEQAIVGTGGLIR